MKPCETLNRMLNEYDYKKHDCYVALKKHLNDSQYSRPSFLPDAFKVHNDREFELVESVHKSPITLLKLFDMCDFDDRFSPQMISITYLYTNGAVICYRRPLYELCSEVWFFPHDGTIRDKTDATSILLKDSKHAGRNIFDVLDGSSLPS